VGEGTGVKRVIANRSEGGVHGNAELYKKKRGGSPNLKSKFLRRIRQEKKGGGGVTYTGNIAPNLEEEHGEGRGVVMLIEGGEKIPESLQGDAAVGRA